MAAAFASGVLALSMFLPHASAAHGSEGSAAQQRERVHTGFATYYASSFEGKRTASGLTFRNDAMVAAHPTLPFGTLVRVTNIARGSSVVVRITDRGPAYGPRSRGVVIDLSQQAAKLLGMMNNGRARVGVEVVATKKKGRDMQRVSQAARKIVQSSPVAFAGVLELRMDTTLKVTMAPARVVTSCEATACPQTVAQALPNPVHIAHLD
jgi:rare lipoprotein A